jgi:hypothetical protein
MRRITARSKFYETRGRIHAINGLQGGTEVGERHGGKGRRRQSEKQEELKDNTATRNKQVKSVSEEGNAPCDKR